MARILKKSLFLFASISFTQNFLVALEILPPTEHHQFSFILKKTPLHSQGDFPKSQHFLRTVKVHRAFAQKCILDEKQDFHKNLFKFQKYMKSLKIDEDDINYSKYALPLTPYLYKTLISLFLREKKGHYQNGSVNFKNLQRLNISMPSVQQEQTAFNRDLKPLLSLKELTFNEKPAFSRYDYVSNNPKGFIILLHRKEKQPLAYVTLSLFSPPSKKTSFNITYTDFSKTNTLLIQKARSASRHLNLEIYNALLPFDPLYFSADCLTLGRNLSFNKKSLLPYAIDLQDQKLSFLKTLIIKSDDIFSPEIAREFAKLNLNNLTYLEIILPFQKTNPSNHDPFALENARWPSLEEIHIYKTSPESSWGPFGLLRNPHFKLEKVILPKSLFDKIIDRDSKKERYFTIDGTKKYYKNTEEFITLMKDLHKNLDDVIYQDETSYTKIKTLPQKK